MRYPFTLSLRVSIVLVCAGLVPAQTVTIPGDSRPLPSRFGFWDRYWQLAPTGGGFIAKGDLDGDGDLDAVWSSTWEIFVARNRGDATFDVTSINLWEGYPHIIAGVAIADIDVDGDLDVVLARTDYEIPGWEAKNLILLNDGRGKLSIVPHGTRLPTTCTRGWSVAAADFDGDGDLDLFFGRGLLSGGLQNQLLLNDGKGFFTDVTATHLPGDQWVGAHLKVADLDRDGDLDVACANGGSVDIGPQTIYWNDGKARFTLSIVSPSLEPGTSVVAGDFDRDGDLDLYFTIANLAQLPRDRLLLNDGAGRFTDVSHRLKPRPIPFGAGQAIALDFEGDGDLDIAVATAILPPGNSLHLLVNDGGGQFTNVLSTLLSVPSPRVGRMTPGDFDGDGDEDLFVIGNYGLEPRGLKVFLSLTTQLYTQFEVKIGSQYSLNFYGDPGTLMLPFVAPKPARIDLGSLGVLALDPASLIALPPRTTNAGREAQWMTGVPNDPGLRGVPIYAQAVSVDLPRTGRMRLTNWMVDVIQ